MMSAWQRPRGQVVDARRLEHVVGDRLGRRDRRAFAYSAFNCAIAATTAGATRWNVRSVRAEVRRVCG